MIKELRIVEENKGPMDDPAIVGVQKESPPEERESRERDEDRKSSYNDRKHDDRRGHKSNLNYKLLDQCKEEFDFES